MKKLMMVAMMILILAVASVPAIADSQEIEQDAVSGDVVQVFEGGGYGSANAAEFYANTGNVQEAFQVQQDNDVIQYAAD